MILHQNVEYFKNLISLTAREMKIPEFYIEKDYWVTYILKKLSKSEFKEEVIFKGGTSLSKGYKAISRFSEDIDLQLARNCVSDNQKRSLLKKIEKTLTEGMIYLENHPQESKRGNIRKTVYQYPIQISAENLGQVSDVIIVEINSLSTPEPVEKIKIESYISEFLKRNQQEKFIKEFELDEFEVNVLSIKRTFIEKVFAVLDYTFVINPEQELATKVRHLYDIYKLYQFEEIRKFLESKTAFDMASKVVLENDFFGNRRNTIYRNSFLFTDINRLDAIEKTYKTSFKSMIYDELPELKEIKLSLKKILDFIEKWEKEYRIKY